jgi:hypothetical protein
LRLGAAGGSLWIGGKGRSSHNGQS